MNDKKAWVVYGGAALLVMLPLLASGFILTLDLVFTPELPMPQEITSSYLFHATLHWLNMIIPSDVLQKIMLTSLLLLASLGMHRLVRAIDPQKTVDVGVYVAGIFFAVNPFTYSRFMAGQYAVLLGYALLPWLARMLIAFVRQPGMKQTLQIGLLTTLIGITSIHTLVAVGILGITGLLLVAHRQKKIRSYVRYGAVALGCFVVLSSYWLVPLMVGQGKTAQTISAFTAADSQAFATAGDHSLERLFHVVRLQGFWAEDKLLFLLPQDRAMAWGLMMFVLVGIATTGAVVLWRRRRLILLWFGSSALIGMGLAIGLGSWTADVPLLAGLREPHKLVALVALFYGVGLAFGVRAILERVKQKSETFVVPLVILFCALPLVSMRVMWWGFDGQLSPRQYPSDWTAAKQQLAQDDRQGKVLFLPWHQYMTFQFAGRIIANPAPAFFGERIIISTDPELEGAAGGPPSSQQQELTIILSTASPTIADELANHNVRYVVLAKEFDYQTYGFVTEHPGFELTADYPTLLIYKNNLWRQP